MILDGQKKKKKKKSKDEKRTVHRWGGGETKSRGIHGRYPCNLTERGEKCPQKDKKKSTKSF